jgi:hypothetical protein
MTTQQNDYLAESRIRLASEIALVFFPDDHEQAMQAGIELLSLRDDELISVAQWVAIKMMPSRKLVLR